MYDLNRDPDGTKQLFELAIVLRVDELIKQGDAGAALELLDNASREVAESALFAYNKGVALAITGLTEEAIEYYKKAIERNAKFSEAHNNLGAALAAKGSEHLKDAIANYNKAIELNPDYAEAYFNLGRTYDRMDKIEEAIKSYRKALELKPEYAEALNNLSIDLGKRMQFDDAIAGLQKASRLDPDNPTFEQNLAIAMRKKAEAEME